MTLGGSRHRALPPFQHRDHGDAGENAGHRHLLQTS